MQTGRTPLALHGAMQDEDHATQSLAACLPDSVWEQILAALVLHAAPRGNPGDVFRLSLVSTLRPTCAHSCDQATRQQVRQAFCGHAGKLRAAEDCEQPPLLGVGLRAARLAAATAQRWRLAAGQ
jgi:hypothetical protein